MSSNRCEGTGEWFLEGETFRNWNLEGGRNFSRNEVLIAHGAPGCGKSMLSSLVIDHFSKKSGPRYGLAYLYFDHAQPDCQVVEEVVSCLIKQLCLNRRKLPDTVVQLYHKSCNTGTRPTLEELNALFHGFAQQFYYTHLILDGIDECAQSQRKRLLPLLTKWNERYNVGLYLSCRSHLMHTFNNAFTVTEIRIEATPKDLELSISNALVDSEVETPLEFQQQLKTRLISTANGM